MNIWRPYTQMHLSAPPAFIKKTKGAYLYTANDKKIFDAISSWWVITHGHCDEEIIEAIKQQAEKIDQVIFSNFSHSPAEELASSLSDFLPPSLKHIFFSDNGSTAVEVAIKMAVQGKAQQGYPQKKKILSFEKAYHGDTAGAMSVSGNNIYSRPYQSLFVEFMKAKQARYSFEDAELYLEDFISKIQIYAAELAAVIIEPLVQGAGGMIIWPPQTIERIQRICHQNNIFLICDEVMTGFGRTGKMFAFEHANIVPDFLCLSKGLTGGVLPLSLTITTDEVYESFLSSDINKMFFHGHSFTGNPIACAAANANLNKFRRENVLAKILVIESTHRKCLEKIKRHLPQPLIRDLRFQGAIGVLELSEENIFSYGSSSTKNLTEKLLEKGIFIRPLGNVIYLLPPYCSEISMIEQTWDEISIALGNQPEFGVII